MSHLSWSVPSLRHPGAEILLLALLVGVCWVGVLGMWRMREPMQALHYLSLPASLGGILLAIAVFLEDGSSPVSWKTLFIAAILLVINSVGAHATARAFRARDLGHWEPLNGDPMKFVRDTSEER